MGRTLVSSNFYSCCIYYSCSLHLGFLVVSHANLSVFSLANIGEFSHYSEAQWRTMAGLL
uniref:Uncharacterized protein n=1 Tax=Anguilla anguilla TaxID=7936 RepID=A0A0E9P9H6_ANGAN